MSEFSAKTLREKRKEKATRMGSASSDKKVDSSDWTPAEPLNADVKTGARPISRRAFKSGGKVCGEKAKANMGRAPRKAGGAAPKDYANAKVNRNVKAANEEREGIKHVGGFKKGGRAKKLGGGALNALSLVSPAALAYNLIKGGDKDKDEKKYGGRTKRQDGGKAPMPPRMPESVKQARAAELAKSEGQAPQASDLYTPAQLKRLEAGRKAGGRTKKMGGGAMMAPGMMPDPRLGMVSPKMFNFSGAQGTPYKRGGKVHSDEAMDKALIKKMVKKSARTGKDDGGEVGAGSGKRTDRQSNVYEPDYNEDAVDKAIRTSRKKIGGKEAAMIKSVLRGRTGKADGGKTKYLRATDEKAEKEYGKGQSAMDRAMQRIENEFSPAAMRKMREELKARRESDPDYVKFAERRKKRDEDESMEQAGYKKGGRTARASGGRTKAKGKTHINIVINAGKKDDGGIGMPPPPPGMPGGPMSLQRPMGPPPGMPGMPPGAPAGGPPMMGQPPMPPMARKSGGRVSKVAKSYKDMEAGTGSGEGRLQKTDIAKRNPKPREDGVILTKDRGYPNKVLGATGGRTAHKAGGKVYKSYKDMDAGAGSGKGRLEKEEIQKRKH